MSWWGNGTQITVLTQQQRVLLSERDSSDWQRQRSEASAKTFARKREGVTAGCDDDHVTVAGGDGRDLGACGEGEKMRFRKIQMIQWN